MLIKNIRYPQLDIAPKKQSVITFKTLLFVLSICCVAAIFTGCEQPQAKVEVREVCEDNKVYKVYGYSRKEIVIENGQFKYCDSGEITF